MKLTTLLFLLTLPMIAQTSTPPAPPTVPAHSVIGEFTVDIQDIPVPVSYGNTEQHAATSVCSSVKYDSIGLSLISTDGTNTYSDSGTITPVVRANGLYCGVVISQFSLKTLIEIDLNGYRNALLSAQHN